MKMLVNKRWLVVVSESFDNEVTTYSMVISNWSKAEIDRYVDMINSQCKYATAMCMGELTEGE